MSKRKKLENYQLFVCYKTVWYHSSGLFAQSGIEMLIIWFNNWWPLHFVWPLWIHIYIYIYIYLSFLGWGQDMTGETLFFSHYFYFPQSTLFKDMCILLLMTPAFYFDMFCIQTPLWLSLNSLNNNIFTWYFPFEIMNICHLLTIILCSETGWWDAHTQLNIA